MGDVWSAIAQYGIVPVVVGVVLYLLIYFQQKRAERKKTAQENEAKRLEEEQRQDFKNCLKRLSDEELYAKTNEEMNKLVKDKKEEFKKILEKELCDLIKGLFD